MKFKKLVFLVIIILCNSVGAQDSDLSISDLTKKLVKVDTNIKSTKEQMQNIKDASYLADLYFVLAEFMVEKSRVLYQLKIARNPNVPPDELDFTFEKRPKENAIGVYDTFLEKFPSESRRDRALFFKAHELRELGRAEDMLKVYRVITKDFPTSQYWSESQLILGDTYFEQKKEFEVALEYYKSIEKRDLSEFTPLAQYKMGWCFINMNKFLSAYQSYENAIKSTNKLIEKEVEIKNDIRNEALQALVWPYSELKSKDLEKVHSSSISALEHFKGISFGYESYVKLLGKLSRRMKIKKRYKDAVDANFEFIRVSTDLEAKIGKISELYQLLRKNLKNVKLPGFPERMGEVFSELEYDKKIARKTKKRYRKKLEKVLKDISIQTHLASKKDSQWKSLTLSSYEVFLRYFPKSKYADKILYNKAGLSFSMGDAFGAARDYEKLARKKNRKLKKSSKKLLKSSLESYLSALGKAELEIFEKEQARDALRKLGQLFLRKYPKDKASSTILFNIGQSYYNERDFVKAVSYFKKFLVKYPRDTKVSLAVNQILDSHNQKENYKAIISDGKWVLKRKNIANTSLRDNVKDIIDQAKILMLKKKSGDYTKGSYAKNMLKMASRFKGTDLGDKALYEAFILYRSQRSEDMYKPGEMLLKSHGKSKYAKQAAGDMVQIALVTADFQRAAKYLEYFGKTYPKDKEANLYLTQAGQIRSLIKDFKGAKRVYKRLEDNFQIASNDYQARNWSKLIGSSQKVALPHRAYWQAKALRELGKEKLARKLMSKTMGRVKSSGNKEIIAKSAYLQAQLALDKYKKIKFSKKSDDQKVVAKKQSGLQALTEQYSLVISTGHPEMTLAALSGLGEIYKNFSEFIKKANIPKGLNKDQRKMFKEALGGQASSFKKQSEIYFSKCMSTAKKIQIYSKYLLYCKEKNSSVELPGKLPEFSKDTSRTVALLRKSLFDKPRDSELFEGLIKSFIKEAKLGDALATTDRAIELFPETAKFYAYYAIVQLHMGEFRIAGEKIQQGVSKAAYDKNLKYLEAKLKKYFGFSNKKLSASAEFKGLMPSWL